MTTGTPLIMPAKFKIYPLYSRINEKIGRGKIEIKGCKSFFKRRRAIENPVLNVEIKYEWKLEDAK